MPIGARDVASMTPQQRAVHDAIASGPRGNVPWPFLAMLDAPELATAVQGVGASLRFSSPITPYQRELATLATAAAFGSGYEWDYHVPIALKEGVSEATVAAILAGKVDDLEELDGLVVAICWDAVLERRIAPDRVQRLTELTDRAVATAVVAIAGYYQLLALFLSAVGTDHAPTFDGGARS